MKRAKLDPLVILKRLRATQNRRREGEIFFNDKIRQHLIEIKKKTTI